MEAFLIKLKIYRWIKVTFFGYRSFVMEDNHRGDLSKMKARVLICESHSKIMVPVVMSIKGFKEEWPQ